MKRSLLILASLVLAGLLGIACGDDDTDGAPVQSTGGYYDVNEVRYQGDVYRCIHGNSPGAMWCENITLGD